METYNKDIAKNKDVELIHLSLDRDEDVAAAWGAKENMPWPTLMNEDIDSKVLRTPYFPGRMGIPAYVMVDHTGKEVARGKQAVMEKIK
ncbi:MAG: TlpA family protein disulfide reductase [Akkermansiaceae bacterium]